MILMKRILFCFSSRTHLNQMNRVHDKMNECIRILNGTIFFSNLIQSYWISLSLSFALFTTLVQIQTKNIITLNIQNWMVFGKNISFNLKFFFCVSKIMTWYTIKLFFWFVHLYQFSKK